MKGAEWRSPVQRVMSTQSRDWLIRVRRWERWGRMRGWEGESERWRCGWVLRRRWSVPLTTLVPTRVICPFTLSLLGLLITSVDPGSIGASKA